MAGEEHSRRPPEEAVDPFEDTLRRRLKALRWAEPSDEQRQRSLEEFERRLDALESDTSVTD